MNKFRLAIAMKKLLTLFILILVFAGSKNAVAQVNLVKNPSMEEWSVQNHTIFAKNWSSPSWGGTGYFTMDTISWTGSAQ